MGLTHFPGGISSMGVPVLGGQGIFSPGEAIFLDPASGNTTNSGKRPDRALSTMATAYAKTTTGNHDVVYYIGGTTTLQLPETVTWSNSYTHLVGVAAAPVRKGNRCRIMHNANFSVMMTISGSGCIFKDIYYSHGRDSSTNLTCIALSGSRNLFDNVNISGPNHATEGAEATYKLINITGHENTFNNCLIGNNTTNRSAANTLLYMDGAISNIFQHCWFLSNLIASTPTFVCTADAAGIGGILWFDDCVFYNNPHTGHTMTQAFDLHALTDGAVVCSGNFMVVGCTDVADATGDSYVYAQRFTETTNVLGLSLSPSST